MMSNDATPTPYQSHAKGVMVRVRLQPAASRNEITGVRQHSDGSYALHARVTAQPEDGKANQALQRLLAKHFHLPKGDVVLQRGAKSRIKTFLLAGLTLLDMPPKS